METDSIQTRLPNELEAELRKMRRNPADFSVLSMNKCKFCSKPKSAHHLINAKFGDQIVGSWCPVHGWLFFNSVELPPTERLSVVEIEDNRLAEQRRREFARRKAAAQ